MVVVVVIAVVAVVVVVIAIVAVVVLWCSHGKVVDKGVDMLVMRDWRVDCVTNDEKKNEKKNENYF